MDPKTLGATKVNSALGKRPLRTIGAVVLLVGAFVIGFLGAAACGAATNVDF